MAECRIVSYMVPDGPPYLVSSTCHAVTWCETHQMEIAIPAQDGALCAIGRIEKATDEAITKINAAKLSG